ncbi:MAG: hypothetical protein M3323_16205, partial [Actinomycetota bacterium]|nr:hypothetical protein [Actinomycetota bacterium]
PGAGGWPAPPASEAPWRREPVEEVEPGPESIDWGSGTTEDAAEERARTAPPDDAGAGASSLEEIWSQPARREPEPRPAGPGAEDIQWHDPARGGTEREPDEEPQPPPPPARRANASVPEEGFYGPRRRRWFRRRR